MTHHLFGYGPLRNVFFCRNLPTLLHPAFSIWYCKWEFWLLTWFSPSWADYILYSFWKGLILALEKKMHVFHFISTFLIILPNIGEAFWVRICLIPKLGEIPLHICFVCIFVCFASVWLISRMWSLFDQNFMSHLFCTNILSWSLCSAV